MPIPTELLDYKQWVLWRRVEVNGRVAKLPISRGVARLRLAIGIRRAAHFGRLLRSSQVPIRRHWFCLYSRRSILRH